MVVLDASALLTWLLDEAGAEEVEPLLAESMISSLNWSEVLQKSISRQVDTSGLRDDLAALGLSIAAFDQEDAALAARLWVPGEGLSLADRACLALGLRHQLPVVTADRAWAKKSVSVPIQIIRRSA
jgi:ribonuclease VapC